MTQVVYTNSEGFDHLIEVPAGTLDRRLYRHGIIIGPPDLSDLGLSEDKARSINNELCRAGICDYASMNGRRGEVQRIIQSVLSIKDVPKARDILRQVIGIYQRAAFG